MTGETGEPDPFEEMIALADQVLLRDPDNLEALTARAMFLLLLNRHFEALAACDRALRRAPDHLMSHFGRAHALCKLRRFPEAVTAADNAIRLGGDRPEFLLARAEALVMAGTADATGVSVAGKHPFADEAAKVISTVRELIMLGPSSPPDARATVATPTHTIDESAADRLRKLTRDEMGSAFEADPLAFLALSDEVLAQLPGHAASYITRGVALARLGRADEALDAAWEAVRVDTTDPAIHYGHGLVAEEVGRMARSVGAYLCAIALSNADEDPYKSAVQHLTTNNLQTSSIWLLTGPLRPAKMTAALYFELGNAYLFDMQFEQALSAFDQAEALEPLLHVALAGCGKSSRIDW